jgi:hypothetical protein
LGLCVEQLSTTNYQLQLFAAVFVYEGLEAGSAAGFVEAGGAYYD